MTTSPRRTAPRAAALTGSLAVHAALLAVAAIVPTTLVAAGDPPAADGAPTVLAWIVPTQHADDVIVTPPAAGRSTVPAPSREVAQIEPVLLDEPVAPPRVEIGAADVPDPPSSRPTPHGAVSLHPGHGGRGNGTGAGGGGGLGVGVGGGGGGGGDGTGVGGGSGVGAGEGGDGDGTGFAPRGGVTRGPAITASLAAPPYPRAARSRGFEGRVVLALAIGADGRVTSIEVAESSGHEDLDAAARAAAADWTFAPALRDGEAVAGTLRVPVRFELTN